MEEDRGVLIETKITTPMRPHLDYYFQLWNPQHKKDVDLLEQAQRGAWGLSEGWSISLMKKGWECWVLVLFILEKKRFRETSLHPSST